MWVYLEIQPDGAGRRADLARGEKKAGRRPVLYDKTCRAISADLAGVEGLVIPETLGGGSNYDVGLLILQLRLETSSGLQNLPLKVRFDDEDRYLGFCDRFGMTERGLEAIGVGLVPPDKRPEMISLSPPQQDAVENFVNRYASRPRFTQGRHNQANRWGPYVFFRILEQVDAAFAKQRESIERRMFEEPYLKRLAGDIQDEGLSKQALDTIRSERSRLRKRLAEKAGVRKILVVEDQLDEGWREVYQALFEDGAAGNSLAWATTADEARTAFEPELDLVVLDVRLDAHESPAATSSNEIVPAGVKLAKEFRQNWSSMPILAATASNKAWTLEPLLHAGIQGYWVKDSPDQTLVLEHAIRNVADLYRKTRDVLEWSDRTRPWIEGLYAIAEEVSNTDVLHGKILRDKAQSLHALLDRAFSPFSRELDAGLQLNVAFLILFSCMNDLRAWCCRVEERDDGSKDWFTVKELGDKLLATKRSKGTKKGQPHFVYQVSDSNYTSEQFPDTDVSKRLLIELGAAKTGSVFRRLKNEVRNNLPLTHGVTDAYSTSGPGTHVVSDAHIREMLQVLSTVVERRRLAGTKHA